LAGFLSSGEHIDNLLGHLVVDALGLGAVSEAAGEEVAETSVAYLHAEHVLQVVDESSPRIVHLQGLIGPAEELVETRSQGGHEQVEACREVAVQGADGYAGFACDLLQGGIHAVCGEFALRRRDELVAALLGVAAHGSPHLLDVALAHSLSLPTMLRAASASAQLKNPRRRLTSFETATS